MLCWNAKRKIGDAIDASEEPSEALHEHLQHCARCREYYVTQDSLSQALIRASRHESAPVHAFLPGKIVGSLRRGETLTSVSNGFHPSRALAVLGSAFVLGTIIFLQLPKPADQPVVIPPAVLRSAATPPVTGLGTPDWSALAERIDDPLQVEMERVAADAKKAITLLAQNFLPARDASSVAAEAPRQN
jgi:hypothetical protein